MSFRQKLGAIALALTIAVGGSQALANQELFSELEQQAQSARELELLEPVDVEVVTREEHQQAQMESFELEAQAEGAGDWNVLLIFLGFIDEGDDIYEIYSSFVSDQVLGTYDPETKQLVVISTNTEEWNITDRTTYVHETVHALQDQHFDIMGVHGDLDTLTDDRFYAVRSLVEGDASFAEFIFLVENDLVGPYLDELSTMDPGSTDDIPFFLMETMMFYYADGMEFVSFIWQDGGWEAVNAVWLNPPTTSEQIIHPQKYHDGEGAIPVAIANPQPVFGNEWRIIEDNAWGELGTRVFLQNGGVSARAASRAAEGWGGDAVYVITNDDESAMVWSTAWDSDDDAAEFLETLSEAESQRLGVEIDVVTNGVTVFEGNGWFGEIHHDGSTVTYFLAESVASLDLMIESQADADIQPVATSARATTATSTGNGATAFWIREN